MCMCCSVINCICIYTSSILTQLRNYYVHILADTVPGF